MAVVLVVRELPAAAAALLTVAVVGVLPVLEEPHAASKNAPAAAMTAPTSLVGGHTDRTRERARRSGPEPSIGPSISERACAGRDCYATLTLPNRAPTSRAGPRSCAQTIGLPAVNERTATPIRLLVNPTAGGGRAAGKMRRVIEALESHGLAVTSEPAGERDEVRAQASAAAHAGEVVVTLGGDGIAGAAADGLREVPGSVLGIIPAGRGNDLARVLGIPSDPLAACALIAQGAVRQMDIGEVDGRAFVGIASVGFDSDANRIANLAPAWMGSGVYAYGAFRALLRWRPAGFQLELRHGVPDAVATPSPEPERLEFTGYSVAFANSRCFGGGMRLAPEALLDDGMLDVVSIHQMPRARYAWELRKVFKGTHVDLPVVRADRAFEAVISADRPFTMYADGDPIGELPLRVRVLPAAIGVLAPSTPLEAFASPGDADELPERVPLARSDAAVRRQAARSRWSPTPA